MNAGTFSNNGKPVAAGSAGGGPIVAWLSATGVEVQFLDVLGEPTVAGAEVAGADFKSNVQVADGVAAIAVGWEEASPDSSTVQGPTPSWLDRSSCKAWNRRRLAVRYAGDRRSGGERRLRQHALQQSQHVDCRLRFYHVGTGHTPPW
jgi:hypothetical protein